MLPLGFAQSNLNTDAQLNDNALLVDAELKSSGAEFTTLSDLRGDAKVLAIGAISPGSSQLKISERTRFVTWAFDDVAVKLSSVKIL